jgi:hypothetical protein
MAKIALRETMLGAALLVLSHAPVHALAARTWVASVSAGGNDAHACTRTAPCKTFAVAVARTAPGGEINCVDADDYGRVTITKSLSIVCDNTEAGIFAAGTVGITVDTLVTDTVTLKGIDIEGFGTGTIGISFIQGGALHVHKVRIKNFRSTAPHTSAQGINFVPTRAAALYVSESYLTDNGSGFDGSGIRIVPTAAAAATVAITNTRVENNLNGMRIFNGSPDTLKVVIADSTIVGNTSAGIAHDSNAGPSQLTLKNVVVANNGFQGVFNGPTASTRIGDSVVTGNATGVENAGGSFTSYKNNQIRLNTVDGTPLAAEMPE